MDLNQMNNVFVLGSSGYIGKALVSKLSSHHIPVTTVGRKGTDIIFDLATNVGAFISEVKEGDIIIFLAAISSPDICEKDKEYAQSINVKGTEKVISELIDKRAKVLFSSSDVVFGEGVGAMGDHDQLCPFGEYGRMKAYIEKKFSASPLFKVIRFSYVMGPGDKYTDLLLNFSKNKKKLDVFEGFERNVVAVSDVTSGIIKLIKNWNLIDQGAINFSGPECISRWGITKLFSEKFCCNMQLELVDAPTGFWNSRPKRIETNNVIFTKLLGRPAKSIQNNLLNWYE